MFYVCQNHILPLLPLQIVDLPSVVVIFCVFPTMRYIRMETIWQCQLTDVSVFFVENLSIFKYQYAYWMPIPMHTEKQEFSIHAFHSFCINTNTHSTSFPRFLQTPMPISCLSFVSDQHYYILPNIIPSFLSTFNRESTLSERYQSLLHFYTTPTHIEQQKFVFWPTSILIPLLLFAFNSLHDISNLKCRIVNQIIL